jgi:hypothetical protein
MAARLNPANDQRTRDTIQTTQLVKRLQGFVLGLPDPVSGKPIEMDKVRVTACIALLKKTLPDLTNTQLSNDPDNPLTIEQRVTIVRPVKRDEG